ncbi:MAG: DUF4435 domain-containing protein [Bacteroidaceae bacterium]|nr:DUF4435 domain-containing protein [Bacteroidaceae bacterium]
MKRLTDNVNSRYMQAADRLLPGNRRGRIVAYVESYDDVSFWRLLLDEFESPEYHFQIMLPTKGGLTKGKKPALNSVFGADALGSHMIACVDSDYDWLMDDITPTSRLVNGSPYVIQTYTYAIENYQCWAKSLYQICVQCTLNDRRPIDIEAFMTEYSRAVWPVFVWSVWFYRSRRHSEYSMQELNIDTRLGNVDLRRPSAMIRSLADRVGRRVESLSQKYQFAVEQVEDLKKELVFRGVTDSNCYLFMQGHHLVENVVLKLLDPICQSLRQERENEIRKLAVHQQQYQNEISAYRHSQMDILEALRKNTHYRDCPMYGRMSQDIRNLLVMLPERGGEKQQDGKDLESSDQHEQG